MRRVQDFIHGWLLLSGLLLVAPVGQAAVVAVGSEAALGATDRISWADYLPSLLGLQHYSQPLSTASRGGIGASVTSGAPSRSIRVQTVTGFGYAPDTPILASHDETGETPGPLSFLLDAPVRGFGTTMRINRSDGRDYVGMILAYDAQGGQIGQAVFGSGQAGTEDALFLGLYSTAAPIHRITIAGYSGSLATWTGNGQPLGTFALMMSDLLLVAPVPAPFGAGLFGLALLALARRRAA